VGLKAAVGRMPAADAERAGEKSVVRARDREGDLARSEEKSSRVGCAEHV